MAVEVEIICIGNELLIGKILDTNSHSIAQRVTALGANVKRITVIQDIVPEISATINEALSRKPHFIIITGGLVPTFDDKTFQGIALSLNQKLIVKPEALEIVRTKINEYTTKHGLPIEVELSPPMVKMATFPENTQPVMNPIGTAPALKADISGTILFALPGVPMEMTAIFNQSIAPLIKQVVGTAVFCQHSIYVANIFESRLSPLVDKVMNENVGVYVKSHPFASDCKPRIELHLTLLATPECNSQKRLLQAAKQLSKLIEENGGIIQGT